jgi:tRNA-splicing ligase RtcB
MARIIDNLKNFPKSSIAWLIAGDLQGRHACAGTDHRRKNWFAGNGQAVYEQFNNVMHLPGITRYALCMPDGHSGYGFPIGGVAAMDIREGGVISPGGIGFDINCGMRLVITNLTHDDVQPYLHRIVDRLYERVPAGVGSHGFLRLSRQDFRDLVEQGARWCVERDYGWEDDLKSPENGYLERHFKISERAVDRGYAKLDRQRQPLPRSADRATRRRAR